MNDAWTKLFSNPPAYREPLKKEKQTKQMTLDAFYNKEAPPVVADGTQFWFIPESTGKGWFAGEFSKLSEGFVQDAGRYGWLIRQYSDGVKLESDQRNSEKKKIFLIKKEGDKVVIQRGR